MPQKRPIFKLISSFMLMALFDATKFSIKGSGGKNSTKDKTTEDIFNSKRVKGVSIQLAKKAKRRLEFLHSAVELEDMYFPPSNRFHALEGFTPTRYAIWVDQRWRITFEWREGNAYEVLFEDYHR